MEGVRAGEAGVQVTEPVRAEHEAEDKAVKLDLPKRELPESKFYRLNILSQVLVSDLSWLQPKRLYLLGHVLHLVPDHPLLVTVFLQFAHLQQLLQLLLQRYRLHCLLRQRSVLTEVLVRVPIEVDQQRLCFALVLGSLALEAGPWVDSVLGLLFEGRALGSEATSLAGAG